MRETTPDDEFQQYFSQVMGNVSYAIFLNNGEPDLFHCLFSNTNEFETTHGYRIYEIDSLVRTLGQKINLYSQSVLNQLYSNNPNHLCYILEWGDYTRKVIIFNLENTQNFNQESFAENLENTDYLNKLYQKTYFNFLKKKGL